jgi:hypothetical protein
MPNGTDVGFSIRGQLISPHYLSTQIPKREDWKATTQDPRAQQIEALFKQARSILIHNKPGSKGSNEHAVRDHLVNPILKILGLPWSPAVQHFGKQLDYALYENQETFERAQQLITNGKEIDALRTSCAVAEAERWGKEFGEKPKKSDLSDPIFQIEFYLGNARRSGGPRWGVLTNGHTWRLYCSDSDPLRHDYLEIELPGKETLFAEEERGAFLSLAYFFSVEALRRGGRLDHIYDEATRQAAAITAELRRQAFGAVELIGSGLMRANPKISPVLAYEGALIQLFRLLFILKAEADGLLTTRVLSEDIAERVIKKNRSSIGGGDWDGKNFWHELHDIFEAIADEYNGHLFEGKPPTSSPAASDAVDYFAPARALLESVTVPNQWMANAIDRLLRVHQENKDGQFVPVRVDYSTLRVRELGTIYEGLLEWRLEPVSESDLNAKSIKLLGDKRIERSIAPGDYKLVADQSDRKATGSYYTPHIVVEFIGTRVLEPLLEEIEAACDGDPVRIIDLVLSQRILDPAMGSGHFLVFTVEYLAQYLWGQLGRIRADLELSKKRKSSAKPAPALPLDSSIEFIRARIAERCVYGLDVNPLAVELAKLSLWIASAGKGVPLSFLNHHLRCGDSLLGASLDEFHHGLFGHKLIQQMGLAVGFIRYINDTFSRTLEDVGEKEAHLKVARERLRRFRLSYDAHLSPLFNLDIGEGFHAWLDAVDEPLGESLPAWLQKAEKIASEFRFFHWELEFPEVWRDKSGNILNGGNTSPLPGFDVILGNPPFVTAKNELARRAYMERWTTAIKAFHLLVPFFERSFGMLRQKGRLGLIVSNAFAKREFGKKLVEDFLPTVTVDEIVDCSGLSFPGHGTPTCIVFGRAEPPSETHTITVAATIKGDLRTEPEDSSLWMSLRDNHGRVGYSDEWISVTARPKSEMAVHPWIFSGAAKNLVERLSLIEGSKLETKCAEPIGAQFITGADDVFVLPLHVARRSGIPQQYIRLYGTGEDVRDWQVTPSAAIIFPYDKNLAPLVEPLPEPIANRLAGFREHLENLIISGTTPKKDTNLKWFEYRRLARAKLNVDLNVIFPQIAMYNHACICDHAVLFKEKAQAIALKDSISEDASHALAACLNSSAAAFWLKQVCFNKGPGKQGEHDRFEFSGNILGDYVVPKDIWEKSAIQTRLAQLGRACGERGKLLASLAPSLLFSKSGEAYDGWYRSLSGFIPPHPVISTPFESLDDLLERKEEAKKERSRLFGQLVSLQEEIDWAVYAACGLIPRDHFALGMETASTTDVWELAPGHRPFELARINSGPPADWGTNRQQLWVERLKVIRDNPNIASIEQSVFKRRWTELDYEEGFEEAFYDWLREKCEFYLEHCASRGPITVEKWSDALWQDPRVRSAVQAIEGPGGTLKKFAYVLKRVVDEQSVPADPNKFKPSHRQLRGKLNVPRERFVVGGENLELYTCASP